MFNVQMSTREYTGHGVVALRGELDVTDAPGVASHLIAATAFYGPRVIMDLAGLDFIDATGLGVLVRVLQRTRRSGGDLPLAAPQELVRKVLIATGLIDVFSVYPSVEDAVRVAEEARRLQLAAW